MPPPGALSIGRMNAAKVLAKLGKSAESVMHGGAGRHGTPNPPMMFPTRGAFL